MNSILSLVSPNTAHCYICFSCICSLPPRWHPSSSPMWTIAMLWIPAQFHFHWAANTCAAARVIFQKHIQMMLCSYLQHCHSFALLKEIHSSSTAWPLVSMYLRPFLVLLSCVRRARQTCLILLWAHLTFPALLYYFSLSFCTVPLSESWFQLGIWCSVFVQKEWMNQSFLHYLYIYVRWRTTSLVLI